MIHLNLSFENVAQMHAELASLVDILRPVPAAAPAPVAIEQPAAAPVAEPEVAKAPKSARQAKALATPIEKSTETPAPTQPASVTATEATTENAASAPASVSPSEVIEYAQVQKAITNRAKVDRDGAVAILAKFGVSKGTELKVEQYAAVLAELA